MSTIKTLDVKILDRELRVACPEEERTSLLDAVDYLDNKMRMIRDAGKIASVERIALMAALNITHELLTTRAEKGLDNSGHQRKIEAIQAALDKELNEVNALQ